MHLMYADESGDTGITNSPTRYFVLTGMVLHELRWKSILQDLLAFRQHLRRSKGLKLREEIHSSRFITSPGELVRIKRNDRLDIMKQCITWAASHADLSVIGVVVDKSNKSEDVFELAWRALIQRFENTIRHRNFPGPANPDDRGMLLPDNTDGKKLTQLLRRMRHYNPVPDSTEFRSPGYRNLTLDYVIEDPFMKDSGSSFFHQIVDVVAYALRQKYEPNSYMRKKSAIHLYDRLDPILQKHACRHNPFGIVEL